MTNNNEGISWQEGGAIQHLSMLGNASLFTNVLFTLLCALTPPPPNQQSDGFPLEFLLKGPQTELRTLSQNCEQTLQKLRTNRIMNKRAFLKCALIGACAMTTKFLDNKICTFEILLSWCFPRRIAFLDRVPLCPQCPPLKSTNFIFIVVSQSLILCQGACRCLFFSLRESLQILRTWRCSPTYYHEQHAMPARSGSNWRATAILYLHHSNSSGVSQCRVHAKGVVLSERTCFCLLSTF